MAMLLQGGGVKGRVIQEKKNLNGIAIKKRFFAASLRKLF